MNIKLFILYGIIFILSLQFISASGITVSPSSFDFSVERGVPRDFQVSIRNDNDFPIYNVSFTALQDFQFPVLPILNPNQSRTLSFRVLSQSLYSNVSSSTVSFLYLVPFSALLRNVTVNVSQDGFVSSDVTIFQNDSVLWQSLLSSDVDLSDFGGSGFLSVHLPALSVVSREYDVVGDFSFFESLHGHSGLLHVVPRSVLSYAHDSSFDRAISFSVHSVLSSSALQANLVGALTVDNNQSVTGYLQVINNDKSVVISGIHLSADRWVKSFSDNDFNLAPSNISQVSSKLVSFVIQPLVFDTSDTNRSQDVVIFLNTSNSGGFSDSISLFINFQNLDQVLINGTYYTVNRLSINDTVDFCTQYPNDPECLKLQSSCLASGVCHNNTLVQQVEAQYKIGQADLLTIIGQQKIFGDVSQRLENKMNSYVDKQDAIDQKVDNLSTTLVGMKRDYDASKLLSQRKVDGLTQTYWITILLIFLLVGVYVVGFYVTSWKYYSALEDSLQLGGDLG